MHTKRAVCRVCETWTAVQSTLCRSSQARYSAKSSPTRPDQHRAQAEAAEPEADVGGAAAAAHLQLLDEEGDRAACRAGRRPGSRRTSPGRTSDGRSRWIRRSAEARANTTAEYCWGYPSVAPSVERHDAFRQRLPPHHAELASTSEMADDCRATSRNLRLERAARGRRRPAPEHPLRGLPARGRQARHPGQRGGRPPGRGAVRRCSPTTRRRAPPAAGARLHRVSTSQPSCCRRAHRSAGGLDQWNESPQAQEPVALGLSIVKPCFSMLSTKSIIAPLR